MSVQFLHDNNARKKKIHQVLMPWGVNHTISSASASSFGSANSCEQHTSFYPQICGASYTHTRAHTCMCTHTHTHTPHTIPHTCSHSQNSSCTLTLWPSSHIRYSWTHNHSIYNISQLFKTSHMYVSTSLVMYVQSLLNTNYVCTLQKYTSTVHPLHNTAYIKIKKGQMV